MQDLNQPLEQKKSITRDIRFDILKSIGIFCIILAHIIPHNIIFYIRNFDVPMMVIVSGSLFYYSSSQKKSSLFTYLRRRIPRLIAPVWLFLSFFFLSNYIIFLLLGKNYPFLLKKDILGSFLLLEGIGYVWIIRVFILMAIISNLVLNLYKYCRSKSYFLLLILGIYIFYEILFAVCQNIHLYNIRQVYIVIDNYVFYAIPYGCLFGLGIALPKMRRKSILAVGGVFLIVFLVLTIYLYHSHQVIPVTQSFKFPPRIYYVAYGVFMSLFAFIIVDILYQKYNLTFQTSLPENIFVKAAVFLSQSTLWVYLWHIFFLYEGELIAHMNPNLVSTPFVSFLGITILSVTTTYIQKRTILMLIDKTKFGQFYSEVLAMLFLK